MPPYICEDCDGELFAPQASRVEDFGQSRVHVLFDYDSRVRTLIVRTKARNDVVALTALLRAVKFRAHDIVRDLDDPELVVLAAPSSFWGRIRGRFDIAQLVSLNLFQRARVIRQALPGQVFRPKRAGRNTRVMPLWLSRIESIINFKNPMKIEYPIEEISRASRILVVDDVMTTGFTMKTQLDQLRRLGAQSIDGLVVAAP